MPSKFDGIAKNVINPMVIVIIILIMIMHIVDLSEFASKYTFYFNYGNSLKGICSNEHFEYETPRFQIASNLDNMKIGDKIEEKYKILIFVICLIVTLYVSLIFGIFVLNIGEIFKSNTNTYLKNTVIFFQILVLIFALLWLVTYLGPLMTNVYVGSPFRKEVIQSYFLWLIVLILVVQILLQILHHWKYLQYPENPSFVEYLTSFNKGSASIAYILFIMFFLLMIYILGSMQYMILNQNCEEFVGYVEETDTTENEDQYMNFIVSIGGIVFGGLVGSILGKVVQNFNQSHSQYNTYIMLGLIIICAGIGVGIGFGIKDSLLKNQKKKEAEKTSCPSRCLSSIQEKEDIFAKLFANTFGFKNIPKINIKDDGIYNTNASGLFALALTVFMFFIIVYVILNFLNILEEKDKNFISYAVLFPFIAVLVVLYVGSIATEYNNMINKYILDYPVYYYKEYINDLNVIFNNNIIAIDYAKVTDTKKRYVCQNYGNGILTVLFAHLFNGFYGLNVDLTPEFRYYNKDCDDITPYEFQKQKEYTMSYYLNSKELKKSALFKYDKCDDVNTEVVKKLFENVLIKDLHIVVSADKYDVTDKTLCKTIYEKVQNDKSKLPLVHIIKTNYSDKINPVAIEKILQSLVNIKGNNVYNDNKVGLQTVDKKSNKIAILEAHNKNNRLDYGSIAPYTSQTAIESYRTLIDEKVLNEYKNMCYELLYTFAETYHLKAEDKKNDIFKDKSLVTKVTNIINKYFELIVGNLSTPLEIKNGSITKYIIANYNSVVEKDNVYTDRVFKIYEKNWSNIEDKQSSNIYKLDFCKDVNDMKINVFDRLSPERITSNVDMDIQSSLQNIISKYDVYTSYVNVIIQDKSKYEYITEYSSDQFSKYNGNAPVKVTKSNTEITAYDVAYNIITSCSLLYQEMIKSYNPADADTPKKIAYYKPKIDVNLTALNSDCKRYINTKELQNITKTFELSKKSSKSINHNAEKVNELIYFIIFSYIVIFICVILFVYNK
jgi:hypothetical protein